MTNKIIVDDPWRIALVSYSFWAQVLSLFALVGPELLYGMFGIEVNPYFMWWQALGLVLFGIVGRFLVQHGGFVRNFLRVLATAAAIFVLSWLLSPSAIAGPLGVERRPDAPIAFTGTTEAATLNIALPFIERMEGMRTTAYQDSIGVWTICAGTTRGVVRGMKKTLAECRAIFRAEVIEYRNKLHSYFSKETKALRLTPWRDTAFVSLAINIGWGGAGKSTATKRLNAGDIVGACDAITWFNKAGGRVLRGLVTRRSEEKDYCLIGVGVA